MNRCSGQKSADEASRANRSMPPPNASIAASKPPIKPTIAELRLSQIIFCIFLFNPTIKGATTAASQAAFFAADINGFVRQYGASPQPKAVELHATAHCEIQLHTISFQYDRQIAPQL